jgi:methylenetetrahydrofolate reductase (NADPH)
VKSFRDSLQSDQFTISAELTLKRDSSVDDVRRQADVLGSSVDGIQVTDNPYAWVQMSALSAASVLIDHGIDPVPILTCRDRNRKALRGELLGLRALGVSSVLLMRGNKVPGKHYVQASTVFDLAGRELIALAASLGREESVGNGQSFFIGTGARVFRPNRNWHAESLIARSDAGAQFIQTPLCFNMDLLRHYMSQICRHPLTRKYSTVISLSPLPSATTAKWLKKGMSDARIPDSIVQRLEEASDPENEGIQICAELMREISEIPGVSGVNLMTTGNPESIPVAIKASGLRS